MFKLAVGTAIVALAGAAWLIFAKKDLAPEVTFTNLQGEQFTSRSLHGKVVMVNFWATSCVTCVKEMPAMVTTYDKYKAQGLELFAVAMHYDPPNYVVNYAHTRKLPFQVALDSNGELARAFGDVTLTPTTYVIDKRGHVLKRYVGEPDFAELHALLEKAIKA